MSRSGRPAYLVVALIGSSELAEETIEQKLSDLGELGIDNCNKRGKDGREWQRGSSCFHDRSAKEATSTIRFSEKSSGTICLIFVMLTLFTIPVMLFLNASQESL